MSDPSQSTLRRKLAGGARARAPLKDAGAVVAHIERGLADALSSWLSSAIFAQVTTTRAGKLSDGRADGRALYAFVSLGDGAFAGILAMPADLISLLVDIQTGAGAALSPPADRAFTAIDMALAAPFADRVIHAFEDGLCADPALAGGGALRRARFSQNFDSILTMEGDPDVWDITFDITLSPEAAPVRAQLLVLLSALDHYRIRPVASEESAVEVEGAWGDAMRDAARRAEVRMVGVLHQRALNLAELDHLEEGAIIPLPTEDHLRVELRLDTPGGVADQPAIGVGQLGAANGWRAVRLAGGFDPALVAEVERYAAPDD